MSRIADLVIKFYFLKTYFRTNGWVPVSCKEMGDIFPPSTEISPYFRNTGVSFFGNAFRLQFFLRLFLGHWFFYRIPINILTESSRAMVLLCSCIICSVFMPFKQPDLLCFIFTKLPCTWSSIQRVPLAGVLHIKDVHCVLWPYYCQVAVPNSFYWWTI